MHLYPFLDGLMYPFLVRFFSELHIRSPYLVDSAEVYLFADVIFPFSQGLLFFFNSS